MDYLKIIPKWTLIALIGYVAILFSFAVWDGRRVEFWPPRIYENPIAPKNKHDKANIELKEKNEELEKKLKAKEAYLSPQEVIKLFPEGTRRQTVKETLNEVFKSIEVSSRQKQKIVEWHEKIKILESIEGDFLYRILTFHKEAECYGDSLNFTHIPGRQDSEKCTRKEDLARQFLSFLSEIEFYKGDVVTNTLVAKTELIRYQRSKLFGHTGWYSSEVFKYIVLDYYGKS